MVDRIAQRPVAFAFGGDTAKHAVGAVTIVLLTMMQQDRAVSPPATIDAACLRALGFGCHMVEPASANVALAARFGDE